MGINYTPPKYTDNPDVPRDLLSLAEQIGDNVLTQDDKDELLINIDEGINQANSYTDYLINNSGIPILKQIKDHVSVDYTTSETFNSEIGSTTAIDFNSITPSDPTIKLGARISDSNSVQAIVLSIDTVEENTTVTVETVSFLEIVSYGTEGAVDVFEIADTQPTKSAPEGISSYALTLNDDNSVKVWNSWGGTDWGVIATIPITVMSLFNISSDDTAKYWFIDRWEDFDVNFNIDNYYTKAENDSVTDTLNAEIEKKEYLLIAGEGIVIDRTNSENPIIKSVGNPNDPFDKSKLFKGKLYPNNSGEAPKYHFYIDLNDYFGTNFNNGFVLMTEGYAKITSIWDNTSTLITYPTNQKALRNSTLSFTDNEGILSFTWEPGQMPYDSGQMYVLIEPNETIMVDADKIVVNCKINTQIDEAYVTNVEMEAYFWSNFEFFEGFYQEG